MFLGARRKFHMKRVAVFIFLAALGIAWSMTARAQSPGVAEYASNSREFDKKSAKQQNKKLKRASRKQQKATRKYSKAQRKAAKNANRRAK
jgi:hypothetical protein